MRGQLCLGALGEAIGQVLGAVDRFPGVPGCSTVASRSTLGRTLPGAAHRNTSVVSRFSSWDPPLI